MFSGPQAGEKLPPLKVRGVFDADAGKEIDFVGRAGGRPLVLIFVHEANRPSVALTRVLTTFTAGRAKDGLHTGVVWLADDATEAETALERMRHALAKDAPVGISPDGKEGLGGYGLNRKVTLTISTNWAWTNCRPPRRSGCTSPSPRTRGCGFSTPASAGGWDAPAPRWPVLAGRPGRVLQLRGGQPPVRKAAPAHEPIRRRHVSWAKQSPDKLERMRRAAAEGLWQRIGRLHDELRPAECRNDFLHCGYTATPG